MLRPGQRRSPRKGKTESAIRTVITFDKGGEWHFLKPPLVDSKGKAFACAVPRGQRLSTPRLPCERPRTSLPAVGLH